MNDGKVLMDSIDIFPWNENFNTDVPKIDEQHRKLVDLINKLASHVAFQSDIPALHVIFDELADYAVYHFATEEAIWNEYLLDDPMGTTHKAVHDSFMLAIIQLKGEENTTPVEGVIEQILSFLTRWLASHILENDRYMAKLFIAMQAGMSLESAKKHAHEQMGGSTKVLIEIILSIYDNLSTNTLHLMRELGERKHAEQELRLAHEIQKESMARIQSMMDASQDAIISMDHLGCVMDWNLQAERIFGFSVEQAKGRQVTDLIVPPHDRESHPRWFSADKTHPASPDTGQRMELVGLHCNGTEFPVEISLATLDQQGRTVFSAYIRDITDRKTALEKIEQLAYYDPLTQLPNRRLLIDRLQQALASSMRNKRQGAVLLVDLDNFKTINETLGHEMGDLLLQQVAQRLKSCVREGDTVARSVSDEFVVILEELNHNAQESATEAKTVGEKILDQLNLPYPLGSVLQHSTPSIGITLFGSEQHENAEEALKRAELAMYQAKSAGRNTVRFYESQMQAAVMARAALETGLREAVLKGQFLLYYQAQVNGERQITGVEALVRWQDPRRGMVAPAEFIPLAEETGLILPLGRWVLETACTQLARWASQPTMAHLSMAVNVSASQFHQSNFVEQVLDTLERTGARASRLKLELTESLLVTHIEDVIVKMNALKGKGVGFSLDDFGTGYSSLSYLKRLPLDQLKIDQGFVRDILVDTNDAAIAKMVVALAESLGLAVIAEGVETDAQRDFLRGLGCHAYQGYLFSRPLPLDEFEAFVRRV
jgi:diguanylate cyclase (GGDEF)-like protein/hemerythrin-like metal-binding protein/PAS domain S-box-containing protein